jgi:HK97 family phage prohead protease
MNKEIRSVQTPIETENRHITGYGILFESESVDMGYIEIIERGAITQEQLDSSDIFFFFNHNEDEVLARSTNGVGSLKLTVDNIGVKYEFDAPNTQRGDELLEHIKRGEIWGASFGFWLPSDGSCERIEKRDGQLYRIITNIPNIFELSCVFCPAYPDTTCTNRSKESLEEDYAKYIGFIMDEKMQEIVNLL